jgi:alpha-glucosidase (family GH31 glycosyl hydrolase)
MAMITKGPFHLVEEGLVKFRFQRRQIINAAILGLAVFAMNGPLHLASAVAQGTNGAELQIAGHPVELRLGFVGDEIARFQFLPVNGLGTATESADAPHLLPQSWQGDSLRLRSRSAQPALLARGKSRLSFDSSTWIIRLETLGGGPSQQVRVDPQTGRMSFPIDGPIFGLGEGGQLHDRRGSINFMEVGGWNNTSFPLTDWGEHLGIPWVVSPKGWGLYFHRPQGSFDLTGPEGVFIPSAPGGGRAGPRGGSAVAGVQPLDGFLTISRQPAGLMRAWAEITGYPALPPLWSLGYIQSHREIESSEQILDVARTFRERNLPCDLLIYLGTGFAPVGWNTDHGEFAFNKIAFPNPNNQLAQFQAMHFRVALHVTPRGANPPRRLAGRVTDDVPAGPYDPNVAALYWAKHAALMKLGVDAWWPDEGEGASAASRLARIQMYWEGPQQLRPGLRPYALHRTGAVGMQRYGGWLWSGDIKSNWKVLARQVPLGLNISVGGTPYWGTDTGGFYQDQARELNGELFARWFQFSAFCPLFRSHGRDWRYRHLPWGFSDIEGPDRDPRIEEICRRYLNLRYQLMPYTYSVVYEGHETGMPIMRALWLHYPDDPNAVARGDQYLWGRDLLVAPVVEKGQTERKLYLPPGRWHDYWTGQSMEGGREIARPVDLATIPLYARAGAIVPHGPRENYTEEKPNDPLTVRIYPGADGRFTMVEDDGLTFSSVPMRLVFTWNDAARTLKVSLEPGSQMRAPLTRRLEMELSGVAGSKKAEFHGEPIDVRFE